MANNLTSSGLYIGNGTLARVARIGSDSELIITKVNYSQSVSGSGTATAAGTVTLPSIGVGEASVQVYNNSSAPHGAFETSPTYLYVNLPASGRYLYSTTSATAKGSSAPIGTNSGSFPSPASVSGTLSISDSGWIGYASSKGTAGTRVLTLVNSFISSGDYTYQKTRQTGAILYGRIS